MKTARREDRFKRDLGRATPDRTCHTCGAPIRFIKSPKGEPQPCDIERTLVVLESGETVIGHHSHHATCRGAPRAQAPRAHARAVAAPAPTRTAPPWKRPAEPATTPQLELGAPTLVEQQIDALAKATVVGWYDERSRRAIAEAVRAPGHAIEIKLPMLDYMADSLTASRNDRRAAEFEVLRLRDLQVGELPLFVATEQTGEIARGASTVGVTAVRLTIHPTLVERFLRRTA